jgi:TRAP-type C4-dicarboxylate transport system permease small subunit
MLSLVTAILLTLMTTHIVLNALMRFFLNEPLYGTNEIVTYWYLPFVALLGIPAAHIQKEHIAVTFAIDRMAIGTANVFKTFACATGVLVSIGFAWFGLLEAMSKMELGATAGVTSVIAWPAYFVVPVVFVLLAALLVVEIVSINGRRTSLGSRPGGEMDGQPEDGSERSGL